MSANGPSIQPELSPQETQKAFVREMKHPILRPGYVPIPVFHEGAELRQQQQHPCYSYIQPSTAQTIRTDGRTPSPTLGLHCRPRSPLHGPSESSSTEAGKTSSPVSPTPEVGIEFLCHLMQYDVYSIQKCFQFQTNEQILNFDYFNSVLYF